MLNQLVLALLVTVSSTVFAAPETYIIDGKHTFPRFEYSHFGYSTQQGRFNNTSGKITLDRAARTGSIEIVIDARSVDTGSALFDEHIQDADFFDTGKYPSITFKSGSLKFEGDKPVAVKGDLTIKGVTKPVTLEVISLLCKPHPMLKKEACGANVTTLLKRSEFNMGKYAPNVSDEVKLIIAVEAIKE